MLTGKKALVLVALVGAIVASASAEVTIQTVPIGNVGNIADTRFSPEGIGAVDYAYSMSKFEITTGQYTAFLNAVAATDTYSLYNEYMGEVGGWWGCNIQRQGAAGSYTYSTEPDYANRPVNYMSWSRAVRFANWMHNGQPTGSQDLGTTESGSYYLNGATTDAEYMAVTRSPGATWALPTNDEWHKAAYHKNDGLTGNYFAYPTSSDLEPGNELPDTGNNANYWAGDWVLHSPYWRTEVGEFENSGSPYGTFDQGGNMSELLESTHATSWGEYRMFRGGAWNDDAMIGSLHASYFDFTTPTDDFMGTLGFRLVCIPEPASLTILVLGGFMLIRRR